MNIEDATGKVIMQPDTAIPQIIQLFIMVLIAAAVCMTFEAYKCAEILKCPL